MRLVGAQHVRQAQGVGRRRDVLQVQLADPVDALQDGVELSAHLLYLVLRKAQSGQVGDVAHLFFGYHLLPPALL